MNAPCHNCEDRRVGCHADCKAYAEFRAKRDKAIERRASESDIDGHAVERVRKCKKKEARK